MVAIVASVNGVAWLVCRAFSYRFSADLLLVVTLATLAVIALGSLEIVARLSLGRGELAALLAGRPVARGSGRDDERRLVNVVDEMAIAAGLPAPPLYVMNREEGINAFVAGVAPGAAVVVVTRGALEQLSRDELQAVIAHEFSHILHGDIRLNLRALCVLQGIVFLSAIGRFMMKYYSWAGTEEGRRFFHLPLAAAGAGVYAVGAVGLLCCRIIQAALARERENLADASAVQFTRNADALCGALARIQAHGEGSRLRNWHGDALAHMLFSPPSDGLLARLFRTHPPIEERMRRINPHAAPAFYFEQARRPRREDAPDGPGVGAQPAAAAPAAPRTIVPRRQTGVAALIAAIGDPSARDLAYAADLLAYLPPSVRDALRDPLGAQAVMLGSVLEEELLQRGKQLAAIGDPGLARKAELLAPALRQLGRAYRLPLVALAVPSLKSLEAPRRAAFLAALRAAIEADQRLTLSEFVLATILDWSLVARPRRAAARLEGLAAEAGLVLSLLAHADTPAAAAQGKFDKGREALALPGLVLAAAEALRLADVTRALERLSGLAPPDKERALGAFAQAIEADGEIRLMEHELLRAVACVLDCPMPPTVAALDPRLLRK